VAARELTYPASCSTASARTLPTRRSRFTLENGETYLDIDTAPLPGRGFEDDVLNLVITEIKKPDGKQHVQVALHVRLCPSDATVGESSYQFTNLGSRQRHKYVCTGSGTPEPPSLADITSGVTTIALAIWTRTCASRSRSQTRARSSSPLISRTRSRTYFDRFPVEHAVAVVDTLPHAGRYTAQPR